MARPIIGVMGLPEDHESQALARSLAERGAEPWLLDVRGVADSKKVVFSPSGRHRFDGLELEALRALYIRISGYNWAWDGHASEEPARWRARRDAYLDFLPVEIATMSLKECLLRDLSRRIPVVNPQPAQELHRLKLFQLHLLRRAGVRVPPAAVSNDWAQLSRFARETGACVSKPLGGIAKTRAFRRRRPASLSQRPLFLQERYPGRTIRCYVVGGRLVACGEILHGGRVDSSLGQRGVRLVTLPRAVQADVVKAARVLGLRFAGVDVQHDTRRDRYALLECNISPMFVGFSNTTGADIPGALADLLVALARTRRRG